MSEKKMFVYTTPFRGQVLPDYIGHHDCTQFDIDDTGAYLRIVTKAPTPEELFAFQYCDKEVRMVLIEKAILLTFRFGNLNWMDAPYNPCLSTRLHVISDHKRFQALCDKITLALIDSSDGVIKYLDNIPLNKDFAQTLFETSCRLYSTLQAFSENEYDALLSRIQNSMTAADIANISRGMINRIEA